jgi:hypothetical protein
MRLGESGDEAAPDGRFQGRPVIGPKSVARLIAARSERAEAFPDCAPVPGWTMMLTLYAARLDGRRMVEDDLLAATPGPPATAAQWLDHLCDRGLLTRSADASNGCPIVALSHQAAARMADHLVGTEQLGGE